MEGLALLTSSAALQLRLPRMTTISQLTNLRAGAPPAQATRRDWLQEARSENIKSSHQFLARFHRLRWIHPAEHLFPTLTIHCCEFAHELVARFPFCVFARANAEREQRGHDPNRDVCRGDEKHKQRKSRLGNPNEIVFVFGTSSSKST